MLKIINQIHFHMKKSLLSALLFLAVTSLFAQLNTTEEQSVCKRRHFTNLRAFEGYRQSALMDQYDVGFYFLDIQLERTSIYVAGNVSINATVVAVQMDTFAVELIDELTVDSVFINGVQKSFTHNNDHIFIPTGTPITQGNQFVAMIYYHGDPGSGGGFFSGITNDFSPSWGNQVTWTLSEPFNANQWWPCKQVLTDKADSSWVFITTSNTNKAGSNGLLTAVTTMPNNKLRYEWKSSYPIVFYLISASVAKYVEYNIYAHPAGTTDSLLIQNFVYDNPSTLPYWQADIDRTADFIELYSDLLGLYPFMREKYGHCMAPLGGGMEHQTMTTLGNFNFYLVCHELAHMWFGDNVTCATWSDIWVNEGFASYGEYIAAENLWSYSEAQSHMLDVHNNVMSEPGGSIYIPPAETNDESRIFDGRLSYDKGSAIIHMLRFEMQDDSVFFLSLRNFQDEYRDSVASGLDFKESAEATSGLDLTDFFDQWYFGEGYPSYTISWYKYGDTLYFTSHQSTSASSTPLFKMLMEYKVLWSGGDTLIRVYQNSNTESYAVCVPHAVTGMQVDPNNWVVNGPSSVILSTRDIRDEAFFMLSPNPCEQTLNISLPEPLKQQGMIEICDLSGRVLLNSFVEKDQLSMDVSALNPGFYMACLKIGTSSYVARFIKN